MIAREGLDPIDVGVILLSKSSISSFNLATTEILEKGKFLFCLSYVLKIFLQLKLQPHILFFFFQINQVNKQNHDFNT